MGQRSERIEKSGTSTTAHYYYLYEGIRPICRYQGGHTEAHIDRHYIAQGEQRKNGSAWDSYYYTRDHLGSVREVLKSDGTLAARYDYDPYGRRLQQYKDSSYVEGCEAGYTGHVTLESGVSGQSEMVLTHFRVYSPELGRWLSPDPIAEMGGLNLYEYCYSDPLALVDPDGLVPGDPFATADGAAIDALNYIKPRGTDVGKFEMGGAIYMGENGCFYATYPERGPDSASGQNPYIDLKSSIKKATKLAGKKGLVFGGYHNHPQGASPDFSPADRAWAYNTGFYLWLTGTKPNDDGHKRYNPEKRGNKPFKKKKDFEGIYDYNDKRVIRLGNEPGKKCE